MAFRAPKSIDAVRGIDAQILTRADGVEAEVLHEKAATLHRLGERLEKELAALREFDERHPGQPAAAPARDALVGAAGEALWYYVVQREVCGLRDTPGALRTFGVPREVHLRMGLPRRRTG